MARKLYEKPILFSEISFDRLTELMLPRINFQIYRIGNMLPGYDKDDIRQELLIALWKGFDKRPKDMLYYDYRFMAFMNRVFFNHIISLHRSMTFKSGLILEYRDELNRSVPMIDGFDELY